MYLKDFIQVWYSKWDTLNTNKKLMTMVTHFSGRYGTLLMHF